MHFKSASFVTGPSQLISEINSEPAIPQAPVYATIRPPQSPHNKLVQSPIKSINSAQPTFNSIPLVKSVVSTGDPPKFHPTNPFYSTLPSNYNASKLPIPNGKILNSPLHNRSANKSDSYSDVNNEHDLKLSSFFSRRLDSGSSSVSNKNCDSQTNHFNTTPKYFKHDKYNTYSNSQNKSSEFSKVNDDITKNGRNPFIPSENSEYNYNQSNDKLNNSTPQGAKTIFYSKSDGDFRSNEKIIDRLTITEKKISEVEEIKTIKKITLNGSNESDHNKKNGISNSSEELSKYKNNENVSLSKSHVTREYLIPTKIEADDFYKNSRENARTNQGYHRSPTSQSAREEYFNVGK